MNKAKVFVSAALIALVAACGGPEEQQVGEFSNDLLGNEIEIGALREAKVI